MKHKTLRVAGGSARYARSRGGIGRDRWPKTLGANKRLANPKSSMLRPGKRPGRRMLVELLRDISLSERARLVHPWPLRVPTSKSPPFFLPDHSCGSLFSPSLLALSVLFFLFSYFASCACVYSEYCTAGEPGAVAGVSGCWRVEGGLQGARLPFWWLGVACASRHEGSMYGLCLAS